MITDIASSLHFYAEGVHGDCALRGQGPRRRRQGEETVIQVWGMGPATSTPAEKR